MAVENPGVWGIDLGQCALKAVRIEEIDGQVTATAFDYVEHPKILSQPDADPDQLTREALEKFLSRNSLRGDIVAISIPGQSGLARFVKLPPVEEKKITDIVRFEAKQQIPFNLDEVVWDYQKIGSGIVTDGFAMETEIGLFAIKRDTVSRYLQHFKDVNVEVHIVQMAPLALCNYVAYDLLGRTPGKELETKKQCVVALDIGTDNSNLVITDGGRIIWQRPIPLGGNHFTRALTKDLKLTFAKAEHLKRNATKSPELKKILSSLKPVLNDFVGEVQRSLGYFTNTHRDAQIQYMIGLGSAFRLPGLQKFISEKLQLDVRKIAKLERLTGDSVITAPVFTENLLTFAVPYGFALQGLKQTHLLTNLLPQEIQTERLIRAKKPWALSAAAAILLGIGVLTFGYSAQYRAVAGDQVKTAIKSAETTAKKATDFNSSFQAVEKQIEEDKNGVRSIVAGQDERLNWLHVMKFVGDMLPLADGSNLTAEAKKRYFEDSPKAQDAHNLLVKRQAGQLKSEDKKVDEEEGLDDLISVNIESVLPLYVADLSNFVSQLTAVRADMDSMSPRDRKTPPKGKGWVVELRGYTYHQENRPFVLHTLLENLKKASMLKPVKPKPPSEQQPVGDKADAVAQAPASGDKPAGDKPMGDKPAEAKVAPDKPAGDKAAGDKPAEDKVAVDKPAEGTPPTAEGAAKADTPPAEGAEEATEPEDKPEDTIDPIAGRISHPVLVIYRRDPDPQPHQFLLIGSSILAQVIGAGTGVGGGPGSDMGGGMGGGMMPGKKSGMSGEDSDSGGMAGMSGMGGVSGGLSSWQPLSSGSVGMGGFGGGMGDRGGMMAGPGGMGLPGGGAIPGMGPMPGMGMGSGAMPGLGMGSPGGLGGGGGMRGRFGGGMEAGLGDAGGGMPGGFRGMPPGYGGGIGGRGSPDGMEGPMGPDGRQQLLLKGKKPRHVRTEFVILFIWKEPTPSDKLLPGPDEVLDTGMGSEPGMGMPGAGGVASPDGPP